MAEPTTERWIYMGRRESVSGGLLTAWRDESGEEVTFSTKMRASAVGGTYEVEVTRKGDSLSASLHPRFVAAADDDDPDAAKWEAEDRAAYTADELRKAEARAKKEGGERFGQITLRELKAIYRKQPAPRRAALLAQVLRYLGAA